MSVTLNQAAKGADRRADSTPRWNLPHTTLVVGVHALSLLGLWYWPRAVDIALFLGLYLITCFGIGIGYHRLLAHRGFVSPRWMRRLLTWMGCAALQGGPAWWVVVHRQ